MKPKAAHRVFAAFMGIILLFTLSSCTSEKGSSSSGQTKSGGVLSGGKTDAESAGESTESSGSDPSSGSGQSGSNSSGDSSKKSADAKNSSKISSVSVSSSTASQNAGSSRPAADPNNLYGLGYVQYIMQDKVTNDQAAALIQALGVKSVRVWNHATFVMTDYKTISKKHTEPYHDLYKKLKAKGVRQIVGMSHFHYLLEDYPALTPDGWPSSTQVPQYDKTPGSDYMRFLEQQELTWKLLAAEFPEVDAWEMGNEMNHDDFLSPYGYSYKPNVKPFSLETKADVTTDMMFAASKGIKAGNPKAITIMPPMAPVDGINGEKTLKYLERIYQNIKSGKFGSTKSDDFFEALAWHPYTNSAIGDTWVKQNNDIYAIAQKNGDGDKKAFLTEVGFVDQNSSMADKQQGQWIKDMYRLAAEKMRYVESIHYYWMFTGIDAETYALFNKDFSAKKKAIAYQEMTGASGNLNMLKK